MSIKNQRIFGLDVNVSLADVENRTQALTNLGLDTRDLDLIRGIADAGVSSDDLQCVSNLTRPVYKTFDRYINDTSKYNDILSKSAGVDAQIQGNLDISGGLSGSAIKFQKLEGDLTLNATTTLKWGDISTSRVSSWSSLPVGATPAETDPILYGSSVRIGGSLGTGKLKTRQVPIPKTFDSEVATHKIKVNLNGNTRYIYAMKGIPLIFKGFFRNFDATIGLTGVSGNTKVSWRIVPLDGSTPESFANIGTTSTSTLQYRSPFSKERNIEVYFNPANISRLTFPRVNINQLPSIKLNNLVNIDISSNQFRNFPDLKTLGPNLQTIELSYNNFFQSSIETERTFNENVLAKIPTNVVSLTMRSCFYGSITADLTTLTSLQTLNISKEGTPYFYPDSNDPQGNLPLVAPSVRTYTAYNNDFRTIPSDNVGLNKYNIQSLPNLISLTVSGNYNLTSGSFSLASTKIQTVNISGTGLSIPNLQNRTFLTSFSGSYTRNAGSFLVGSLSKFSGCTSLSTLSLYASSISGSIPKFSTNRSLSYLDLRFCNNLVAGRPDKTETKLLYNDTFLDCVNLSRIYIAVDNPLFAGEIENETFSVIGAGLTELMILTSGRSQGSFPNLNLSTRLVNLWSYSSGWTGYLPNLPNSPSVSYIDLSYNNFGQGLADATISYSDKSNLRYLFVNNNQLKGFSNSFNNLPNLLYLYASSNQITGTMPRFDLICSKLERLILNNNQISGYTRGLDGLLRLRIFDISNNNMGRSLVDSMLFDLVKNYNSARRSGVVVNLLGNSSPTPYPVISGLVSGTSNIVVNKNANETLDNKTYSAVSSTGSANGTGATFNVTINNNTVTITPAAAGKNYATGETLTISNIQTSRIIDGQTFIYTNATVQFTISTTSTTDTTQFVGRAAVDYLRKQGWVVQVA